MNFPLIINNKNLIFLISLVLSSVFLILGLTSCAPAGGGIPMGKPAAFSVSPTFKDVAYEGGSNPKKLDVYLPSGNGPFPVVINIHGGGFKFGDKSGVFETIGKAFLSSGYALVSIDYRLSGEAIFPAAVQDGKAAVRFLKSNSTKYKLDPDKIALFGQSAGGNIASMIATTAGIPDFEDSALGNAGISSQVQAVINWFGPTDFSQMDAQAKAQGCSESDQTHNKSDSFESAYLGAAVPTVPELVRKSNPITYISKNTPPFLIQKGDQDCTVPIENTKMLADALKTAGVEVKYDFLKNAGHGDTGGTIIFESESNIKTVIDFLNGTLK
jgi:acetyl esterase/lipase